MPSWGDLLSELQPHTDASGNTVPGLSCDDLRTKHLKRNDGDFMESTIDFQREEYEALMKVLGLDNDGFDETDDTAKYFDAWNFGRTDEDSNFFATTALS